VRAPTELPDDAAGAPAPSGRGGGTALAAVGLAAGFASSFLGIGGGLIIVPALTVFRGFPLKRAIGTSLGAIVLIAAIGVATESWVKPDNIHWLAVAGLTAGSLVGSWIGAALLARIPTAPLRWLLICLLVLAAARLAGVLNPGSGSHPLADSSSGAGMAALAALGVGAGISSSMFGIGGGVIAVPGMMILFEHFAFHGARATSLAMIVPTSVFGVLLHERMKTVEWPAVRAILPAACIGAILGVIAANRLPEAPLRYTFAIYLMVASWRLLAGGRGHGARRLPADGGGDVREGTPPAAS